METLADFSHLLFVVLWAVSGLVGLLAVISPAALEALSAYGNRTLVHGLQVRADRYWIDIDTFVFAHGRSFGAVVLGVTCYLWLISRHGPEAYSKSTLLAVVAVALMMGIVALRHIVRQSLEIHTRLAEAHADPLTGLANRRAFETEIGGRLAQWEQRGKPLCLLLMDIDDFKGFNDRFGHSFGDRVLGEIGAALRSVARRDDFIARWGGDEFAVLLGSTHLDAASEIAERLRKLVGQTRLHANGQEVNLTASIGIAEAQDRDDAASLYGRTDAALYAAKEAGRNCSFRNAGSQGGGLLRCGEQPGFSDTPGRRVS